MKTTYTIQTIEGAGFLTGRFFSYLMIPTPTEDVAKVICSSLATGKSVLATGPKGKWSPSVEASVETIRKNVIREVRSLESKEDLRPSQVRRFELLKGWVGGA